MDQHQDPVPAAHRPEGTRYDKVGNGVLARCLVLHFVSLPLHPRVVCRVVHSMLDDLGMELQGRHHSGIDDVRNITAICVRLLQDGAKFGHTDLRSGGKRR